MPEPNRGGLHRSTRQLSQWSDGLTGEMDVWTQDVPRACARWRGRRLDGLDGAVVPLGAALLGVEELHAHLHAGCPGADQRVLHLLLGHDELPGALARVVGDGEERALCREPHGLVHLLGRPRTPAGRRRGTWARPASSSPSARRMKTTASPAMSSLALTKMAWFGTKALGVSLLWWWFKGIVRGDERTYIWWEGASMGHQWGT